MSHEMLQFIAGERRHGTSENVVSVIEPATGEVSSTTRMPPGAPSQDR